MQYLHIVQHYLLKTYAPSDKMHFKASRRVVARGLV